MATKKPNISDDDREGKRLQQLNQARYRSQMKGDTRINNMLENRAMDRYVKAVNTNAARGDALSGRTPDGGTRSLLEGFKSFIRGGGLRGSGR